MSRKKKPEADLDDLTPAEPSASMTPPAPEPSPAPATPSPTTTRRRRARSRKSPPAEAKAAPPSEEAPAPGGEAEATEPTPSPEEPAVPGDEAEATEPAPPPEEPAVPSGEAAAEGPPPPAPHEALREHGPQLVVFLLADEHYGVDISAVDSIIKLQPITFVPHVPAFVKGVTNLRGRVLPVVDLRRRFGLPTSEATRETRIVVAQVEGMSVGMLVDRVSEVLRVPAGAIEPPSPLVTTVDSAFITGIVNIEDRLIVLLDLEQVLSPGEKSDRQIPPPVQAKAGNRNSDEATGGA